MKKITDKISMFIATGFGLGYFPVGGGTLAAFVALFFVSWFLGLTVTTQILVITVFGLVGVAAATRAEAFFGVHDDHRIVVDEIVSIFITFIGLSAVSLPFLAAGFITNRILDIWKPLGINYLQRLPRGWGIMADDILVGIYAAILLRIFIYVFG